MRAVRFLRDFSRRRDSETTTVWNAGWEGHIGDDDYAAAVKAGAVVAGDPAPPPSSPTPEELKAAAEKAAADAAARHQAIVDAIAAAVAAKDKAMFNKDGSVSVKALEGKLGFGLTEAERDAAWQDAQKSKPDLFK